MRRKFSNNGEDLFAFTHVSLYPETGCWPYDRLSEVAMRLGSEAMIRTLVVAGMLLLGGTNAFALPVTCSSLTPSTVQGFPNDGLPSGAVFKTDATSTPAGSLTSFDGDPYPVCSSGSSYYIPFYVSALAQVLIGISEVNSVSGTYFGVSVNGTSVVQQSSASVPPGVSLLTDVPAGIDLLGITENYGTSGLTGDSLSVSVAFQSFIPEPATLSLLGFGAACLIGLRRRQRLA